MVVDLGGPTLGYKDVTGEKIRVMQDPYGLDNYMLEDCAGWEFALQARDILDNQSKLSDYAPVEPPEEWPLDIAMRIWAGMSG